MLRTVFAVAVVLVIGASGWGQEKRPDSEGKSQEQREKEHEKWLADRREAHYKKYPTEVPDLLAKAVTPDSVPWAPTADVAEAKDDSPAVAAAKRAIRSELKRFQQIQTAITSGHFSSGVTYLQFTACVSSMYEAAAVVWDDPEKLLPFAENMVVSLMRAEEFNMPRVWQGIEEPQLLPQLTAARCRAEVVVLKLREQIKARSSRAAPSDAVPGLAPSATDDAHSQPYTITHGQFGCSCQAGSVRRPLLGRLCGRR